MISYDKKTIDDVDVKGKRVLLRAEFNVPLDPETGKITDDRRIRAAIPTIRSLVERGARLIIVSHLGRPKGFDPALSLEPVAARLAELTGLPVTLAKDVIGPDAMAKAKEVGEGEILLLENVRYHKEETKNRPEFAKKLASMAELYASDAFGAVHRAHASTAGVASFLPAVAGYTINRELEMLGRAVSEPKRPLTAILGGAKVFDKIGVIRNLIDNVDNLLIGGGMAYTFQAAKGWPVGSSICEADKLDLARELMALAEEKGVNLVLPVDTTVSDRYAADATPVIVPSNQIPDDMMGLDIGPKTAELFGDIISKSGTVVWNGPVGVFEFEAFSRGTRKVAQAIADAGIVSIIGGGDSAAAMEQLGFASRVTHISTGGGASLEFLEGKVLPGIDCLLDRDPRGLVSAGNWKMNYGVPSEALSFIDQLMPYAAAAPSKVIVAVPFTALDAAVSHAAGTPVRVAAQNGHQDDKGAFTGEVSMKMLAEMHVSYVVIGHSERRAYFGETDQTVNAKVKAALGWGVRPIICVGELKEERQKGETETVLSRQVKAAFDGIAPDSLCQIMIAYEPVWAIGTGDTATDAQAEEACAHIRALLNDLYGEAAATMAKILYGGSINSQNAAGLFAQPHVDGGLVGGASLDAAEFGAIAKG
ncbi:MAG TPA: triose-phosphate isomerase [Bacillota bacterium]|nr:triose-phosphate isomerase [Fastidiosipila sp.]HPX93203.1 triose-phosphate isomerase [Bacillota bacterium]HQB81097.1 triose-phosphate isomerase [Bacillota bacterium]